MSPPRRFLIDSSAWIESLRANGEPTLRERVRTLIQEDRAVLCDMVLLELWNGARDGKEQKMLSELEAQVTSVPITFEVWKAAHSLARKLRAKGLTVPATDILIAACAEHHGLGLVHKDEHFERIG